MTTITKETAIQIQVSRHQQTPVDTSRQIVTWRAFAILAMFQKAITTDNKQMTVSSDIATLKRKIDYISNITDLL